jgi:DNA-directed RNA polymerase specialized sigma24 family protein
MTDPDHEAAAALYEAHYRSLLGLAAGLVSDATADAVMRDCLAALHTAWPRLRDDNDRALSYLRQCVVNRSHSVLRHSLSARRIQGA